MCEQKSEDALRDEERGHESRNAISEAGKGIWMHPRASRRNVNLPAKYLHFRASDSSRNCQIF